ncbi:hydroxymethylglutaryl-CoA synthase [Stackebrandtia endophytica]|uniref:Hydroxymethylglutaryl-CoA synthase n=1 Tax=Stackebrandtia endophytica TaxID=1496996 RepID=A0A543ARV8_9ACTN|nr:hydroxymethylglutaryl-CoA synthase family protein [Stackebrandtia endophytica]TQL75321.1 hydroxymethylglutaryl-CoA synthase [Stackebrandtia endophytica]
MTVGIEAINAYIGRTSVDVADLFRVRGLDTERLSNLMMDRKSVNLPCEDPVSNAVNAAKPLIDAMTDRSRERIELVVVGTESGLDFGKPISTYIHHHLGLGRRCRSFEVKHACYGGTAALQTAAAVIAARPGTKALVIATDAASVAARGTYWEPSQGAGAVAMIVGDEPVVLRLDSGANGYYSHEVMDTLRPRPDLEDGDSDLSLISYLEALEHSFRMYTERVAGVDLLTSFQHLVLHTPFAGMVKGAHRQLLRRHSTLDAASIPVDFDTRVADTLTYCRQVGNIYSAALYLALCSLLDQLSDKGRQRRIGLFSYGSGCASEFYSGVVDGNGAPGLATAIAQRHRLSLDEYELISDMSVDRMCGVRDRRFETSSYQDIYDSHFDGHGLLVLDSIDRFHRRYRWS